MGDLSKLHTYGEESVIKTIKLEPFEQELTGLPSTTQYHLDGRKRNHALQRFLGKELIRCLLGH